MPITQAATRVVANRMPKLINPTTHAVIDYVVAGTCIAMGAGFWKNNKRASIAAIFCGAATVVTSLLTDYPGGVRPAISFETHGKIDAGLAGLTATMPAFFAFRDEPEAKFFTTAALAETIVTGLTDFNARTGKVIEMPVNRPA